MANQNAMVAVARAVKKGILPKVTTLKCVDCGKKAKNYDHRDYDKPLEVEPVCVKCNHVRGRALGTHDKNPEGMVKAGVWIPKEYRGALLAYAKILRDEDRSTKAKK